MSSIGGTYQLLRVLRDLGLRQLFFRNAGFKLTLGFFEPLQPPSGAAATMTTGKYTVNGREYDAEILKKSVYGHPVSYIYCFEGNVLKYRVVSGLYYDTSKNPINEVTTYRSISTKVDAKLFDLSNYSLMP